MPMKYIELGECCEVCTIAIANDDYSGTSDEEEAATRAGIEAIGQYLIIGRERGFSHSKCCICDSLPGERHEVGYFQEVL